MDRFDAILEHLKKAQSAGLDSMASRFDAIAESLEQLIQSTKSAVEDARPTVADDILAVAEIEDAVAELRAEEKARAEELARAKEQALAAPAGISLDNLRTLDAARSQSELLRALLPMLSEHVGRAVVLVIREGVISAWSGIGFDDGEKLRDWHGGVAASPAFQQLVETSNPMQIAPEDDPLLSQWLEGDVTPDGSALLPISLRGKLMGIVYIDHTGDQPWDVETAQSLNAIGCWLIDTLHHRSTVPTPTLAGIEGAEGKVVSTEAAFEEIEAEVDTFEPPPEEEAEDLGKTEPEVEPVPEPEEIAEPPLEEPSTAASEVEGAETIEYEVVSEEDFSQPEEVEEEPAVDYDFEPEPTVEPEAEEAEFDPSATVRIERDEMDVPPPEEAPVPAEVPPPEPPDEEEDRPSVVEIEAPPPVRPVEPPPEPEPEPTETPDEDARQEEARRFARLLVSEIKLYNEDEVERGRVEKDISRRLKEDIDRSREMYEKRIPADVRESHDYFFDELVRILADGDPDALGM
jgi:hypothetical protein